MKNNKEMKEILKENDKKTNQKEETKKEKEFYKKWWFWLILLAIIIVIGFILILVMAFNIVKGDVKDLALEIHKVYKDATVYSSAEGNTIYIELRKWDNKYSNELGKIINIVKTKVNNNELSMYNKFVTLAYIKSNGNEEELLVKTVYSLPDFVKDENSSKTYIVFEEYEKMYDTLNKTMDSYTGLFNSIY